MKTSLRVLLLGLILFSLVAPVMAADYPPLTDHLIDGTGRVDLLRFEAAVAPLVKLGAVPLGIVYNGSGDTTFNVYEAQILEHYGYGVPAESASVVPGKLLDPNVIAIAIDYGGRNISVYVGDNWRSQIGDSQLEAIVQSVAKYALEDPNMGLESGFGAVHDYLDPPSARALREFLPYVPWIVFGLILLTLTVWTIFKSLKINSITRQTGVIEARWHDLYEKYEGATRRLNAMIVVLSQDYKTEADNWTSRANEARLNVENMVRRMGELSGNDPNLITSDTTLADLLRDYQRFESTFFPVVENWVVMVITEADRVDTLVAGAKDLLGRIEPEIDRVSGWYEQARGNSRLLPPKAKVFDAMFAELDAAKQLVLYQANGELRGARILEGIRITLIALEKAAALVVEAENKGISTLTFIRDAIMPWASELPSSEALAASPLTFLQAAIGFLTDDSDYNDVVEPATAAKDGFDALKVAIVDLAATLNKRDEVAKVLSAIFRDGYRSQVEPQLAAAASSSKSAVGAISAGNWQEAANLLSQARNSIDAALTKMQHLVALRKTNEGRLTDLDRLTALALTRINSEIGPLWTKFENDFSEADYQPVSNHLKEITKIIKSLVDLPNDEDDLFSSAKHLNSMDVQDFEGAEKAIASLYRQHSQALTLMDELIARHALAVKARDTHAAALDNAGRAIQSAKEARATKDEYVDTQVDLGIAAAEKLLAAGREAARVRSFIAALEAALNALRGAEEAKSSANGQISELNNAFRSLQTTQETVNSAFASAARAVDGELDTIVQSDTMSAIRQAKSQLEVASNAAKSLAHLEDRRLLTAIRQAIEAYNAAQNSIASALRSLSGDQSSYNGLVDSANDAINSAESAISAAASKCGDHRAGSAGDGDLSSARSLLPSNVSRGDSRSGLTNAKSNAQRAEKLADSAKSAAEAAIRRYEAAEEAKRQAELKRQRDEAKKRQDALDRAAAERRAAQQRQSSSHSTAIRSTSSISRNTGGSAKHGKF